MPNELTDKYITLENHNISVVDNIQESNYEKKNCIDYVYDQR